MSEQIEGVPLGMRVSRVKLHIDWKNYFEAFLEPDNVYGKPLDQVPDPPGHKRKQPLEFRPYEKDEWFINPHGQATKAEGPASLCSVTTDKRRIILQEPPKPQERVFLFRQCPSEQATHYTVSMSKAMPLIHGTVTELPAQGTPEYEALVERLGLAAYRAMGCTFKLSKGSLDGIRAVLAELFKAEGK